jgi:hypothetical protein
MRAYFRRTSSERTTMVPHREATAIWPGTGKAGTGSKRRLVKMIGEMRQADISEATYALVKDAIIAEDGLALTLRIDTDCIGDGNGESGTPEFTFIPQGLACPDLRAGVQAKGTREIVMYFAAQEGKQIIP